VRGAGRGSKGARRHRDAVVGQEPSDPNHGSDPTDPNLAKQSNPGAPRRLRIEIPRLPDDPDRSAITRPKATGTPQRADTADALKLDDTEGAVHSAHFICSQPLRPPRPARLHRSDRQFPSLLARNNRRDSSQDTADGNPPLRRKAAGSHRVVAPPGSVRSTSGRRFDETTCRTGAALPRHAGWECAGRAVRRSFGANTPNVVSAFAFPTAFRRLTANQPAADTGSSPGQRQQKRGSPCCCTR
jgi:hypothetical protein